MITQIRKPPPEVTQSIRCGGRTFQLGYDDEDLRPISAANLCLLEELSTTNHGTQCFVSTREIQGQPFPQNVIHADSMRDAIRILERNCGARMWLVEDGWKPLQQQTGVGHVGSGRPINKKNDFMVIRLVHIPKQAILTKDEDF